MRREAALCALLAVACTRTRDGTASAAPAASVARVPGETELSTVTLSADAVNRLGLKTATVERKMLRKTRSVPGEVIVPSGGVVTIVAPFAARVLPASDKAPLPKEGTTVHRDDKLLRLVPLAPVDHDLRARAEKDVTIAGARLRAAEQRLTRLEKLLVDGASSEKQIEEARADRDSLAADLVAAKKRLTMLTTAPLSADVSVDLSAPRDGVVRLSPLSAGQLVASGATLLEIVGSASRWVRAAVYVGDAQLVPADRSATITTPGAPLKAAIPAKRVAGPPSADPASATVDLFFELPTGTTYEPGERVTVVVDLADDAEVSVLPWSSVVFDAVGGAWVYEKTAERSYRRRRVDPVRVVDGLVVLANAPKTGTEIVSVGAAELFGFELGTGR